MRILVTGGAGFIGSHIVDAYINEGHEVSVIDNLSTGSRSNLNPAASFYHADIRDDVSAVIRDISPEIINHHAAQISISVSVENPAADAASNIIGTLNIIEAGLKAGLKKFIFASTGGAIYGAQDYFPVDEMHPLRPLSPYAVAKLSCEKYLYCYKYNFGLDYITLRYSNVYGPRQNPYGEAGVVAIFTNRLIKGGQPMINGDGLQTRDYLYVRDVVEANLKALRVNASGEFNISTGIETSVNELFSSLIRITGGDVNAAHGPAKKGEQLRSCLSYRKAQEILGWSPGVSIEEGLRNTVEWFLIKNGAA
ncbi:MAG: UDP-glucose 4-epimerase [Nitrospirae bacterium CG_4_10_14_3_um_filter_44_29]|nr:NAD-dependent epimerase/dehydratase family protein [Nitrospirota bacterium]OIO29808.1 MAG: UDP-glucose 4-epimerase [Nitrospirae bacterium CG1_02_44_142]PIP70234.1 MAG: UDP-glucose 4-epimerase [Nitrospirae bacterium CG22_combo_CG10-13_8_21_14_all_44_11]PIV40664.1 MAG: UDP-glucose 4-epimerase [Nitrospirae bacterium CG02_land_8_20_14_3_00_44_33]PIV67149.1 MAG: UDP-glucose 4-epimerase [Nitrospirae bacterium CG01_land_8_20_14_3_00_44_22]PIW89766.1 MAG: UDP-glucose 4-epimerase [Nitrospirae bacter